jgi:hypothetical protein
MNDDLKQFVLATLDDDHGISTEAWEKLNDFLHNTAEFELLVRLAGEVEATDGRFYIK